MIEKIVIRNFKSLKDVKLELKPLNVITGINGVGKSSLIQTLLLFRQSFLKGEFKEGISLDGELTGNLGSVRDIENISSDEDVIEISINNCINTFRTKTQKDETILRGRNNLSGIKNNSLFSKSNFQYISASRISPDSNFKKSSYNIENKQFGKNGEHVVSYISEYGKIQSNKQNKGKSQAIVNIVKGENGLFLPLEAQINHWLNYISKDVRLNISKVNTTNYNLNFEYFNGTSWDSFTSENSAFGLTYSLPVITALLAASAGDIVIIENPESDLHPQAQSKLGELIARCANSGVQVIIETHSDHILNGIRVAISSSPSFISNDNTIIFYFYKEAMSSNTLVETIKMDNKGRIPIKELKTKGISGFFDQIDLDYLRILKNQLGK